MVARRHRAGTGAQGQRSSARGLPPGAHWKERVAMAQWWSDHLDALRDGATVLPFRAGER
ncbi:hypothetical protein Rumeso_02303 [Rubellimicrobium mesophilum DSM 19309]|uniref:Integrase n=1 Tax=Rubellimicrobium mesophilum DSM 19309 TaxID=442562 RepID=A0A017HQU8_9RHOB|nr:hypothetical protein Rumeso_02303 [Rubellimicrobium mesophilum DSM 19309]